MNLLLFLVFLALLVVLVVVVLVLNVTQGINNKGLREVRRMSTWIILVIIKFYSSLSISVSV